MSREAIRQQVQDFVKAAAAERRLSLTLTNGRRGSDIVLISLEGERKGVLAIPNLLLSHFPDLDLELLVGVMNMEERLYQMTLVVTDKLTEQPSEAHERRAKLRLLLQAELLND